MCKIVIKIKFEITTKGELRRKKKWEVKFELKMIVIESLDDSDLIELLSSFFFLSNPMNLNKGLS